MVEVQDGYLCFMRIDKYLWCVRLFKTRSMAAEACNAEKVKLNGVFVKPAKEVLSGDTIEIKAPPIWRLFCVDDLPKNRVGAALVVNFIHETTTAEALEEWKLVQKMNADSRSFGIVGRPTKRHRRDLDSFKDR